MRALRLSLLGAMCLGVLFTGDKTFAADFEAKKGFEVTKLTFDPVQRYKVYAPEYLARNTEAVMRSLEREAKDPMRIRDPQTDYYMGQLTSKDADVREKAMLEIMSRRFPRVEVKDGSTTYYKLMIPPSAIARLAGVEQNADFTVVRNLLVKNAVTNNDVSKSLDAVADEAVLALKRNPGNEEVNLFVRNLVETAEAIGMREGARRDREPQWAEAKKEIDALLELLKNAAPTIARLQGLAASGSANPGSAKPVDHGTGPGGVKVRARPNTNETAKDPSAADFRVQLNRAIAAARTSGDKDAIAEVEGLAALFAPANAARFEVVKGGFARLNSLWNQAMVDAKKEIDARPKTDADTEAKELEALTQAKMVDSLGRIFFREEWSKIPKEQRKSELCKKLRGCPVFRSTELQLGCAV